MARVNAAVRRAVSAHGERFKRCQVATGGPTRLTKSMLAMKTTQLPLALRISGWALIGTGVAGLVVGSIFIGSGQSHFDEATADGQACELSAKACFELGGQQAILARYAKASDQRLVGFILGGVAVSAVVTGIVLLTRKPARSYGKTVTSLSLSPVLGPGSLGIRGAF